MTTPIRVYRHPLVPQWLMMERGEPPRLVRETVTTEDSGRRRLVPDDEADRIARAVARQEWASFWSAVGFVNTCIRRVSEVRARREKRRRAELIALIEAQEWEA